MSNSDWVRFYHKKQPWGESSRWKKSDGVTVLDKKKSEGVTVHKKRAMRYDLTVRRRGMG